MLKRCLLCLLLLVLSIGSVSDAQTTPETISLWHIATPDDPFYPVLQSAIERFNSSHTDVQFAAQPMQNDTFKEQLDSVIGTEQQPDVFQTWGGGVLQSYAEAGVVRPIPELQGEVEAQFLPQSLAFSTFGEQHYAVPANMAGVFLWYNHELFARYNLELPTTWDRLMMACQTFRANGITPIALGNRDGWSGGFWLTYLILRLGGHPVVINTNQQENVFNNPVFIEAGERLQQAVEAGCFEPDYQTNDLGAAQRLLATGSAAMQLQGDWNLGGLRNVDRGFVDANIAVMPFPIIDEATQANASLLLGGTGHAFAISSTAPEAAANALLELLTSEEFSRAATEAGYIPAMIGYEENISDPVVQQMARAVYDATTTQLYYDQLLPNDQAELFLSTTQQLLDRSLTPQQAAEQMALTMPPLLLSDNEVSLRSLADEQGFNIGSAVSVDALRNDTTYASVLSREFNTLTPEMSLKMDALRPDANTFNFTDADFIMEFADNHNMRVRGHTLVWYRQLPGWLEYGSFTRDEMLTILREHIMTVVGRYRGRIAAWDVVNEAIDEDGSLRDSIWLRTIGPEYIDYAFQWAREADPDALLFYNDYDTEGLGPKSDAVYALVEGLVQRGIPIDGVGLQMHIAIDEPPAISDIQQNMDRLAALGLQVQITEMDVQIQGSSASEQERLSAQAQLYADVADLCVNHPACDTLVTWGFTDRYTWIPEFTGNPDMPLLFDADYEPKPAYYALIQVFAN